MKFRVRVPAKSVIVFAACITTLLVYIHSLCPTVYLIDSGELAAVSYTLGIAHPTGYPLYTIISYFFAHLPGEPIRNLNLLSALFSVIAVIFLYLTACESSNNEILPLFLVSLYAFSPAIWKISITNEVYPLTALFCVYLIYLLFRLKNSRVLYLLAYTAGLSFTNHIIIFSTVIPLCIYVLLSFKPSIKKVIICFLFFIIGLSSYVYLIARTLGGAELAWGNTHNLQRLFWHLTGKQYQVWMFSLSPGEILNNVLKGLQLLVQNFLYAFVVLVPVGFYWLYKNDIKRFWLFLIITIVNFLYTINYAIPDIESYYIPGFIALLIVCTYGLRLFKKKIAWYFIVPASMVIPLLNYQVCTLRNNTFGFDYSYGHIAQLPENSLLVCSYWDIYSPTIYFRKVKNIRKDLTIIDKELLRRTWYIKYLQKEYPEFCQKAERQISDYLIELYKFEYGKPYDAYTIQGKYIKMIEKFVEIKESDGVFFALPFPDHDLNQVKPDHKRIPVGLNFLITKDTVSVFCDFSNINIHQPRFVNDDRLKFNIKTVERMAINNINYLTQAGKTNNVESAKQWLKEFNRKK